MTPESILAWLLMSSEQFPGSSILKLIVSIVWQSLYNTMLGVHRNGPCVVSKLG